MRWPWSWRRRRGGAGVSAQLPAYRPGSWANVAYPPADGQTVRVIPGGAVGARVRLGFADGTSVVVEESSAESDALHAVARDLLNGC